MSPRYHLTKSGNPAICRANKRPCPLGGTHGGLEEIKKLSEDINIRLGSFTSISLNEKERSKWKRGTKRHTDTTEYGCQALTILKAMGINTDQIKTSGDLQVGIAKLSPETKNYEELKLIGRRLNDYKKDDFRINETKALSNAVYKHLKEQNFSDDEIVKNLRQMGKEDNKYTVGDIGLNKHELSLKAGSKTLQSGGIFNSSEKFGYPSGEHSYLSKAVSSEETKILKHLKEKYIPRIEKNPKISKDKRFEFSVSKVDGEKYFVIEEKNKKTLAIPFSKFDDSVEYKNMTEPYLRAFSKFIDDNSQELASDEEYRALQKKRNSAATKDLFEKFNKIRTPEIEKDIAAKFLGIRDNESYYFAANSSKVTKGHIPSYEDFMKNEKIKVHSIKEYVIDSKDKIESSVEVTLINEKNKTFTQLNIRTRYAAGQLNSKDMRMTSDYKVSPNSGTPETIIAGGGKKYTFAPLPESIYEYETL